MWNVLLGSAPAYLLEVYKDLDKVYIMIDFGLLWSLISPLGL